MNIHWFTVLPANVTSLLWLVEFFKNEPVVFHWHDERFAIPAGATSLLLSKANDNRAFLYGDRVVALQFHLEATPDTVTNMLANSTPDERIPGKFVQDKATMISNNGYAPFGNKIMAKLLDYLRDL